jgi:hypothetical protein
MVGKHPTVCCEFAGLRKRARDASRMTPRLSRVFAHDLFCPNSSQLASNHHTLYLLLGFFLVIQCIYGKKKTSDDDILAAVITWNDVATDKHYRAQITRSAFTHTIAACFKFSRSRSILGRNHTLWKYCDVVVASACPVCGMYWDNVSQLPMRKETTWALATIGHFNSALRLAQTFLWLLHLVAAHIRQIANSICT